MKQSIEATMSATLAASPTVLVIDDDPASRSLIEPVVAEVGARRVDAGTRDEVVRALVEEAPALIILNAQINGESSLDLASRIVGFDRKHWSPLIVLGSHRPGPSLTPREAFRLGAVDHLVAPVDPAELRAKFRVFLDIHRRTQAAARSETEARERLAKVLANVNDMFLILDPALRCTYANDRVVQVSGVPRSQLVGEPITRVFPDLTVSPFETEIGRVLHDQEAVHFEVYNAPLDRWFDHRAYPSSEGVMLVTTEITEAKKAAELRSYLAAIVQSADEAIISKDLNGLITSWNKGAEHLLGYQASEVIGKPISMLMAPQVIDDARVILERIRRGQRVERFETRRRRKDGTIIDVSLTVSPIRNAAGAIIGASKIARDITQEKWAEARLRESEGRFRHTADHAPVLIWVAGINKGFQWLNRPWLTFTGRAMEQELGYGWCESLHPDDRQRVLAVYESSFDARRPFKMEYRLRHATGVYRWLLDEGIPIYEASGAFQGYIGSCVDIHDRKHAEERQHLLAEAGRILGSSLDYETTLAQVSEILVPAFSDWCGLDLLTETGEVRRLAVVHCDPSRVALAQEYWRRYPPRSDEETGLMAVMKTGQPLLHPVLTDEDLTAGAIDAEHLALLRELSLRSLIIVPMQARGRTLGAMTLAISESARTFGDDDLALAQELASRAALAVDNARLFSEAARSARDREEALNLHRNVENQLMLLVEASGSLSVSLDLSSVLAAVLNLSSRLIQADGYAVWRLEPASGRWTIAHSAGLSEHFTRLPAPSSGKAPQMTATPVVAEDVFSTAALDDRQAAYRREGIRSLLSVPLNVRGEISGTLVFYYRTPQRFSEVDLRVATAISNLAASAIGTAELYEVLKTNNRRKDEFLAMLAHELRNPLSAISNAVQVARRTDDAESREWSQEVIDRQVRHLSRLMDDLLDVSRITRGKITLKRELIDTTPVLSTAVEAVRPLIEERKHELIVSVPSEPLWVRADVTRLEQILVNLLTNAAKYTENGGTIRLSARRDGSSAVFSVKDNGEGIPTELFPEMFELFAQGDRTLARSEGGLGIGLTLVRSLTEMHGGHVLARSDGPGLGSEFTVTLPSEQPPAEAPGSEQAGPASGRTHRRVLIVDDNVDTARGMARLLKLLGHDVAVTHDGPSALQVSLDYRPDFILLDIGLPGMSGYEVAHRLRREVSLGETTIIAVSGYGQEEDRRRSKLAGIDYHFVKPVDHDTLLELITGAGPEFVR